ncbi:GlgB N-terminal domain-containing protein, partial [Streptomyces ardesiacus]
MTPRPSSSGPDPRKTTGKKTAGAGKKPAKAAKKKAPRKVTAGSFGAVPAVSPAPAAADRERLLAGTHHDPHAVLGAHRVPGGVAFRALRPYALAVTVLCGELRVELHDDGDGFFSGLAPLEEVPAHRLLVTYEGTVQEAEDPYRFLPTLGELDLHLIGEGRHE